MISPSPTPLGAPVDDENLRLRLISRLSVAFLLDVITLARRDDHVLDTLLASAIIQANIAEINRRADLQVAFAQSDTAPPDEMRRPISMSALANSLDLPFETVRRRVTAMVARGGCRFVDGGVIVPTAVLEGPEYVANGFKGYERIRAFYYQLSGLGLLRDLPPPTAELGAGAFPIRAIARLAGSYVLRVVERLGTIGDLLDGLIVLEVFRSNTEHLPPDLAPAGPFDTGEPLPDDLRRPIAITTLARRLGIPHETARRHVAGLIERGACRRVRGGLIVPLEALRRPNLRGVLAENAGNLHRFFGALSQLGVLQVWDSVRPEGA